MRRHHTHSRRGPGRIRIGIPVIAALVALVIAVPILVVIVTGIGADMGAWASLASSNLGFYIRNSALLALGVGIGAGVIGVGTAWLVTLCAFPGRRVLEWALVLPLAAPAYIIAYAYSDFLQHAGPVQSAMRDLMGWGPRDYWFPNIRSVTGAILVFSLVFYPYVYLIVRATFLEQSVCVLEASRALGRTPWGGFWRVALPLARPSIAAGVAIAMMETLADYGTVAHFGVQTFTTAIYQAYAFIGDRALAARLALMLMGAVVLLLALEHAQRGRVRNAQSTRSLRHGTRYTLSGVRAAGAFTACAVPVLLGAVLPAGILLDLSLHFGHDLTSPRYLRLAGNTVFLGILAATAAVGFSAVLAYGARLSRSLAVQGAVRLASLGYVLPGSVIAIGILIPMTWLDEGVNALALKLFGVGTGQIATGSVAALLFAYIVRFLMISLRTTQASLARITPHMDDAARALGRSPRHALRRVHVPMMRAGLLTAGFIVFVEVVKELPATLILRPFDYDTLAIQAHRLASDERLAEASSAALAIFVTGLVGVLVLTRTITAERTSTSAARDTPATPYRYPTRL